MSLYHNLLVLKNCLCSHEDKNQSDNFDSLNSSDTLYVDEVYFFYLDIKFLSQKIFINQKLKQKIKIPFINLILMNPLSAKIQQRLHNIREKYADHSSTYDRRSKTPNTYLNHQMSETRRSTIQPSYHFDNPEKFANLRGDISNKKASLNKEIQKIRENYAASRKKIFDDFSRQPSNSKGQNAREYIGQIRNINDDLASRDRGYSDYAGLNKDLKRDYPISKITQNYDFRALNDKIKARQYTLGKQSQRQSQFNGYDRMDRINKEYSKALEKAYEFSKEIGAQKHKYPNIEYVPMEYPPSPAKLQFDRLANLKSYDRQFGRDCNTLHQRLSFGKQDIEKYFMRDNFPKFEHDFENSSPIKKIKQFDSTRKDLRGLYNNQLISTQLASNTRSMIGLKQEAYNYQSPIRNKKAWIDQFDHVQNRLKGYLYDKKELRF